MESTRYPAWLLKYPGLHAFLHALDDDLSYTPDIGEMATGAGDEGSERALQGEGDDWSALCDQAAARRETRTQRDALILARATALRLNPATLLAADRAWKAQH